MWALPDLRRINSSAKTLKHKRAIRKALRNKKAVCQYSDNHECEGKVTTFEVYDVFSDDPKFTHSLCERHYGYYGYPDEGLFECCACSRTFSTNMTWEVYSVSGEDGNTYCLNCYREKYLSDSANWIELTDENIEAITFENIRCAPHLIAVGMETPKELVFAGDVTFDNMTGEKVVGSMSTVPQSDGLAEMKQLLRKLKDDGVERAVLILNGGFQFCCSVGAFGENRQQLRKAA